MAATPLPPQPPEELTDDQLDDILDDGADPKDLLKDNPELQEAAKGLAKHAFSLDKWVERQETIETRRQRFYWRGDQYLFWKSDSVGFVPVVAGQTISLGDQSVDAPRYTDVYNIYTPYGESLMSTLVQNPPGVNWQPDDPSNEKDITASQTAGKYQQKVERDNCRKNLQSEVARLFYTDGRTTLYVRPEEVDGKTIEKIEAFGVLETKPVPITARSRDQLVAYIISDEIDVFQAKADNPDYADGIKEGADTLGESAYRRIARLGVLQGTRTLMQGGDAFAHMVTRHRVFLRRAFFKHNKDLEQDFLAIFPNGAKITFVGGQYCGSENISIDDQLTIGFPYPGDGMSRPSMGKRMIPLQDAFNDELNLWHEAHDYCVPTTFVYSETGDIDAIREMASEPGTFVPFTALPPGATSAQAAFFESVLEAIPATLPQFVQFLQGPLAEFITGAFPALFGGDTGQNDTAKGIAIQRDQAMGRMSTPWNSLQELFANAYLQAVKIAVQDPDDEREFNYIQQTRTGEVAQKLSIADLKAGSFRCTPDTDASFPDTTSSKRNTFMTLMTAAERNPVLAEVMSDPTNMEYGHELIGLPDLVIPGAQSQNKQLIEIDQLLKEQPLPPSPQEIAKIAATMAASGDPSLLQSMAAWEQQVKQSASTEQPPPPPIPPDMMKSSIPVDEQFDFHSYEYQVVKDWLSSDERRDEDAKGNVQGVQNVRLHGLQHYQFMMKQMMQQAMMQAPPPPKGKEAAGKVLEKKGQPGETAQPGEGATSAQVQ